MLCIMFVFMISLTWLGFFVSLLLFGGCNIAIIVCELMNWTIRHLIVCECVNNFLQKHDQNFMILSDTRVYLTMKDLSR